MYCRAMGRTVSIHFPNEDEDLYEWMERMHEEGDYANRAHVVRVALKHLRDEKGGEIVV